MANCIARCEGHDKSRVKEEHRLGSEAAKATAATWETEAVAYVSRDGSGYVEVRAKRRSTTIHRFDFGPEATR